MMDQLDGCEQSVLSPELEKQLLEPARTQFPSEVLLHTAGCRMGSDPSQPSVACPHLHAGVEPAPLPVQCWQPSMVTRPRDWDCVWPGVSPLRSRCIHLY
jgi:hypothetical protein